MQVPCGDYTKISAKGLLWKVSSEDWYDSQTKYSLAMTIGDLKGESAIRIHRDLHERKGKLFGRRFWARGYCVSTVGLDEGQVRKYVQEQEKLQKEQEEPQLKFG